MTHRLLGLHHVTATVDEAQPDLDFCGGMLGLRLVKRTVNFDNHHVYHFYYGDEGGTPGTIWTTFPYHGRGVRVGTKGVGQVTATAFSVPAGSIDYWRDRLRERGGTVQPSVVRFGEESLVVSDPSGLSVELVATGSDARQPWTAPGMERGSAVRGLHSVSMRIDAPDATIRFLADVLGFSVAGEESERIRLSVNGGGPGRTIDVIHDRGGVPAENGLGTVHHVALAISTAEEQLDLREDLLQLGFRVTPVRDRQYFQSIYFREPGGVLIEAATIKPGFAIDEPLSELGQHLKLPPWEEPHRPVIEAGLAPIVVRA